MPHQLIVKGILDGFILRWVLTNSWESLYKSIGAFSAQRASSVFLFKLKNCDKSKMWLHVNIITTPLILPYLNPEQLNSRITVKQYYLVVSQTLSHIFTFVEIVKNC